MFVDQAKVRVRGGRGGDGCLSFRREKFVPRGGSDGGDGGHGGSIVFQSDAALHTLLDLRYHAFMIAERGVHGKGKNMHGKRGRDTIVRVPVGTLLRDEETRELLWDFQTAGERFIAAQGGRGGQGNARFATSTNRAPRRHTEGQPGQDRWLLVELKLLADVGLLGFPNAGKSTLISAISAAKPKIADYPFTTLTPNLGVVELHDYATCVVADIPGLVPDAHLGKGLGHQFLKHIERTRLLVHLLDLAPQDDDRTPWTDFLAINHELACFNPELAKVPQIVVATKMDVPDVAQRFSDIQQQFAARGHDVLPISAATGMGLDTLRNRLSTSLLAPAEEC